MVRRASGKDAGLLNSCFQRPTRHLRSSSNPTEAISGFPKLANWGTSDYSLRSATTGSSAAARRAGIRLAAKLVAMKIADPSTGTVTSKGPIP
jgi:hypothetical protein